MEHTLQPETEVKWAKGYAPGERSIPSSVDIPMGRLVDEKISDIIRMTVATAGIVLESEGVDAEYVVRMRDRVLKMLDVKERRS